MAQYPYNIAVPFTTQTLGLSSLGVALLGGSLFAFALYEQSGFQLDAITSNLVTTTECARRNPLQFVKSLWNLASRGE